MDVSTMTVLGSARMAEVEPLVEFLYWKDGAYRSLTDRLLFPVRITRVLGSTSYADLQVENHDGLLARDNAASPYNVNSAGQFDPALDEGRIVTIKQGLKYRMNAASGRPYTRTTPTSEATGSELTDQAFAADPTSEGDARWVSWYGANFAVNIDVGSAREISGVSVSGLSKTTVNRLLPAGITINVATLSNTGPFTQVGSFDMSVHRASPSGQTHYLFAPVEAVGRWVRLVFSANGSSWQQLDEIEVHGKDYGGLFLSTVFTGHLGDEIGQQADGVIELRQVRDKTKRLDDQFISTFKTYTHTSAEAIVCDLLTNSYYGLRIASGGFRLDATSFTLPKWTSQNQSVYKACLELAKMIGWVFDADEYGLFRFYEPEYGRTTGERVFVADQDLREWKKNTTGRTLRNVVIVRYRDTRGKTVTVEARDANSVARFGERRFVIEEPSVRNGVVARQLAGAVLRDYGVVVNHGTGVVDGDPFARAGQVVTVVESLRTAASCAQLYRVGAVESAIEQEEKGGRDWTMRLTLRGYRYRAPSLVQSLRGQPQNLQVTLNWAGNPEGYVTGYNAYISSSIGQVGSLFADVNSLSVIAGGLTNQQTYCFRVAAHAADGIEGDASGPLAVVPTSAGGPETSVVSWWAVTSLSLTVVNSPWRVVRLRWPKCNAQDVITGYHIYRSYTNTLNPVLITTKPKAWDIGTVETWYDESWDVRTGAAKWFYRVAAWRGHTGQEGNRSPWAVASLA